VTTTGPLTVADLDRTPDDGRRYELVDGGAYRESRTTELVPDLVVHRADLAGPRLTRTRQVTREISVGRASYDLSAAICLSRSSASHTSQNLVEIGTGPSRSLSGVR
jgi:hypothetical protein